MEFESTAEFVGTMGPTNLDEKMAEAATNSKPPQSKQGKTRKRHWQMEFENANGVRLTQMNWKSEDMREIDGAGVNEGWCSERGFCTVGTQGINGPPKNRLQR